jgi:hypothetical protein
MDFTTHFSGITDYPDQTKISHLLTDMIGLCLLGSIASCDDYQEIEDFGNRYELWLHSYLQLPHSIPSHDTLERLFIHINPIEFNSCFITWVQSTFALSDEHLFHIDGKSNRRSMDNYSGKKMLHIECVCRKKQIIIISIYGRQNNHHRCNGMPKRNCRAY